MGSYQQFRLKSAYFSVVVSVALVLFLAGILGILLLKSTTISNHFKAKIAITLFLKDSVEKENITALQRTLQKNPEIKKVNYITKKAAAKAYSKTIGKDFLDFLGTNPLKNSIDIYFKPDVVTLGKLEAFKKKFDKNPLVFEVLYDKSFVKLVTKNVQQIRFWLLIIGAFFLLIAIVLISNAIRLSIYSKRFTINTMQLVGATKSFIRRPFIWQNIRLGFLAAILALAGLMAIIYYVNKHLAVLRLLEDYTTLGYLAVGIIGISFVITATSAFFATQRFLNLKTEELY